MPLVILICLLPLITHGHYAIQSDGSALYCQTGSFCPGGYSCEDSCLFPGNKVCTLNIMVPILQQFCGNFQRPRVDDANPRITVLDAGSSTNLQQQPLQVVFVGTITLVQSKGKNILVDTGTNAQKASLVTALRNSYLRPQHIDFVITSHGHPDHNSNNNLFIDSLQNFDLFQIEGGKFSANALFSKQKYYILNDPNLELIETPGHTPQDTSLIVRNAQGFGTVGVVGDLFLNEDSAKTANTATGQGAPSDTQKASMKLVICQVDWIIPGHGPMFRALPYKTTFGC